MIQKLLISKFALIVLVLIASTSYSIQDEPNTIHIEMGDFYFKPETIHLKPGQQVKIEFINIGKLEHEFMVGRLVKTVKSHTDKKTNNTQESKKDATETAHQHKNKMHGEHEEYLEQNEPTHIHTASFEEDFFNEIEVVSTQDKGKFISSPDHGTMLILEPGGSASLSFKVPDSNKGEWEIACFIPGHYEANMRGKIIVE